MKNKKAQIGGLTSTALSLMVAGLVLMFTVVILSKFGAMDVVSNSEDATSVYNDTVDTVSQFSEWLPIIGIVAVAGLIIFLIVRSFPISQ